MTKGQSKGQKLETCGNCLRFITTMPVRLHRDTIHKYQWCHRVCPRVDKLKVIKV